MNKSEFDIAGAKKLADDISGSLDALPKDRTKYAVLRAEVEDLKSMLTRADAHQAMIEDKMKSVYTFFGRADVELRADGFRAGILLGELGRILGLD